MMHVPRRRFGQNFLHDRNIIAKIITAIDPRRNEHFVEIGPGQGVLTEPLSNLLAVLHVVEIDRDLIAVLRERFPATRLIIHAGDALEFDFATLPCPLRVVGNLPYNISTPLLFHLARYSDRIVDGHFMLQREVVDRMVADPSTPAYGRLSVTLQARFDMVRLFTVGAGAFTPVPKVESAIVRMRPRAIPLLPAAVEPVFQTVVTRAFTQRRKTLRNALAGVADPALLASLDIDPGLRPEALSVQAFLRIATAVHHRDTKAP
ncbi:MAG: 16S rRNA (adenine(1518)-N(6)/adenine(1519)-N(6))-dimethyltransferase RsmA [Betaproteobacteria bacterium]|nr:16S rRNA (adenine(1518)-N(6)/adenine(1519)-N(6))-dimethyltransferase RsmA [Betaproteobacteria bacterium]